MDIIVAAASREELREAFISGSLDLIVGFSIIILIGWAGAYLTR